MTLNLGRHAWLLTLALLLIAPAAHASEPGYVLIAEEVFASGLDHDHAMQRLRKVEQEMVEHLETAKPGTQGAHVAVHHLFDVAPIAVKDDHGGLPRVRLRGVMRCVVWVPNLDLPPRAVMTYRRKFDVELDAPAAIVIQAQGEPAGRTTVRCTLREGVRVGWAPLSGTPQSVRNQSQRMGIGALEKRPERERMGGLLLRYAWKQLLAQRSSNAPKAVPQLALKVGRWLIPIDPERSAMILGDDGEAPASLNHAEAAAIDQAYDIMIDPEAAEQIREDMWRLRQASPPFAPGSHADQLMRMLSEPRARASGGLLKGLSD